MFKSRPKRQQDKTMDGSQLDCGTHVKRQITTCRPTGKFCNAEKKVLRIGTQLTKEGFCLIHVVVVVCDEFGFLQPLSEDGVCR